MRLHPHEFIRRFLLNVLPKGFHRICHYGHFASTNRAESIATARALLNVVPSAADLQHEPDVAHGAGRFGDRAFNQTCDPPQQVRRADVYAGLRRCSLLSKYWFSNAGPPFKQVATTTKKRAS
jgi:hypothetical protein